MYYKIYCIYDACADFFGEPFIQVNEQSALRTFVARFANADGVKNDMILCYLGGYDAKDGKIISCSDGLLGHKQLYTYEQATIALEKLRGEFDPSEVAHEE